MSKWEIIALGLGIYAAGAALSLAYLVSRGTSTGATFDGFTGRESERGKALEAVALWPFAVALTIRKG